MSSNTAFPKFEVDIKDLWTTRGEEAYVAHFQEWYKKLQKRSVARETAAKSKSFRLMDLPAELRNRIYAFAFQNEKNFGEQRSLALLTTPAVTRVSKQIRQETLPLFFATTSFRLNVASDFEERAYIASGGSFTTRSPDAGTLHMKQEVKKALRYAGNKALIRNIEISVCNVVDWRVCPRGEAMHPLYVVFSAKLKIEQGLLMVDISRGLASRDWPELSDTIDDVIFDMRTALTKASSKEGFQGFSLRDLEQIVRTLRCEQKSKGWQAQNGGTGAWFFGADEARCEATDGGLRCWR